VIKVMGCEVVDVTSGSKGCGREQFIVWFLADKVAQVEMTVH
jgi:hypothetical protein